MQIKITSGYRYLDPNIFAGRCPHCHRHVTFEPIGISDLYVPKQLTSLQICQQHAGMRKCSNPQCNGLIFYTRIDSAYESWPAERIDFDEINIPERILSCLDEAASCHAAGAYRASALMVRRGLEELCADRNASGKDLKEKLTNLGREVLVPRELIDAADEIRLLGNDAAHVVAKTYDEIGKPQVEAAIDLTKELLKATYQYSALIERLRALKRTSEP